jgi:hypothetical protein
LFIWIYGLSWIVKYVENNFEDETRSLKYLWNELYQIKNKEPRVRKIKTNQIEEIMKAHANKYIEEMM